MKLSTLDHTNNFKSEFIAVASDIVEIGNELGIFILPYRNPNLPHFSRLSFEQQLMIVDALKANRDVYQHVLNSGGDIKKNQTVIWYAIKKLGLTPPSNLFDLIGDDEVIEIYDGEVQIFRNFNFYKLCSYSLEELSCFHWSSLYKRDDSFMNSMLDILNRALSERKVVGSQTPPHLVEETKSPFKYKIHYGMNYISPLFSKNSTLAHFLVSIKADLVNPISLSEQEKRLLEYGSSNSEFFEINPISS